jgi:hypothetical protein
VCEIVKVVSGHQCNMRESWRLYDFVTNILKLGNRVANWHPAGAFRFAGYRYGSRGYSGLLASLLGLAPPVSNDAQQKNNQARIKWVSLRAGVFGFACLLGLFGGIYIRTHNFLSPPKPDLGSYYLQLQSIGFSDEQARTLAVKQWGLELEGDSKNTGSASVTDSVLFSEYQTVCDKLVVDNFVRFDVLIDYLDGLEVKQLSAIAHAIAPLAQQDEPRLAAMKDIVEVLCEK